MHVRDAAGRQVSLLNDDSASAAVPPRLVYRTSSQLGTSSYQGSYGRSPSPFPCAPELLRSDSHDSQASSEPISPLTPMYDYGRIYAADDRSPYEEYYADPQHQLLQKQQQQQQQQLHQAYAAEMSKHRPPYAASERALSYEEESNGRTSPVTTGKRYPCRYRDSHGCEKTFTTSGHASRHSKIHTAEKAVHCTFAGCAKKFTRADNMKQHLETHYKDKSRMSAVRPALSASDKRSSVIASRSSQGNTSVPAAAVTATSATLSPAAVSAHRGRPSRDMRGLDALAMAVACQEGA